MAWHSGWWWANERFAVLTERPRLLARDNVGRLHRGEGAAMEFPDGYGLWAWRGMPIPGGPGDRVAGPDRGAHSAEK